MMNSAGHSLEKREVQDEEAWYLPESEWKVQGKSKKSLVYLYRAADPGQLKPGEDRYRGAREHFEAARRTVCGHLTKMFSKNSNFNDTRGSPPP